MIPGFKKRKIKNPQRIAKTWSSHQQRIFDEVAHGSGHTIVLAVPGAGKTTTIVEAVHHVPVSDRTIVLAFNANIVKDIADRLPKHAEAMTFHKLGFAAVRKYWGKPFSIGPFSIDIKGEIAENLAIEYVGDDDKQRGLRKALVRAFSLAKAELTDSVEEIEHLVLEHSISMGGLSSDAFAEIVMKMMDKTRNAPLVHNGKPMISFDDMIWLPFVHRWEMEKYDRIFVDEAQDLSNARAEMVLASLAPNGRILACGDTYQAIFGFAGAKSSLIKDWAKKLNAKILPLSVSYRLPKRIVLLAQKINKNILPADNAIEGVIENITLDVITNKITNGCAILSRTNFALVNTAFRLVRKGIRANIQGKDIGDRFLWRISVWNPKSISDLIRSIRGWQSEMGALLKEKRISTDRLDDEAACILKFCEECKTLDEVKETIKEFFNDDPAMIKLSTVHKAKGLEWDDVLLLESTFKDSQDEQEVNLRYVACTRSKKTLTFVHGKV